MTLSVWLDDNIETGAEKQQEKADVVIIGGGVIGCGAAYLLAKRKLSVTLLEANKVAGGASGRNAGFVMRGIQTYYNSAVKMYGRDKARFVYEFAQDNLKQIKAFVDEHGQDLDYESCGSYLLASSLDELEDLSQSAELMLSDGFDLTLLKEDPIDRDFYGAIFNPCDAAINPVKLVRALLTHSNATVFENEPVTRLESGSQSGSKTVLVRTAHRIIEADRVLLATNAYAPFLNSWFQDKLKAVRGQILVTQPLKKQILTNICYANYGFEYFRQLKDKRLLLGGCRQLLVDEEIGYADIVTKPVQQALGNYLKDHFPDIAGVPIDYRFSGVMAFTNDGLPIVGELSKVSGVFFAVACNGHGLGFGLNMSRVLVELAMDGTSPGIFSQDRASLTNQMSLAQKRDEKGP